MEFNRQSPQSIYAANLSWSLGSRGFLRLRAARSDGDNASFDRTQLEIGLHHPLTDHARVFAVVGTERIDSDLSLQSDFIGTPTIIRLRKRHHGLSGEFGFQFRPHERLLLTLSGTHADREQQFYNVNLPDSYGLFAAEVRLGHGFSLTAEARSGEDYREYRIGPKWVF